MDDLTQNLRMLRLPFVPAYLLLQSTCCFAVSASAQVGDALPLADYSLEQLMNVEVTSAGRKAQKLEDTSTAISVITAEDIRHSGMTSLPELLRRVPGQSGGSVRRIACLRGGIPSLAF